MNCELNTLLNKMDDAGMIAMWAILATMLPEKEEGIKARLLATEDPRDVYRAISTLHSLEEDAEQEGYGESCRSATALLKSLIA